MSEMLWHDWSAPDDGWGWSTVSPRGHGVCATGAVTGLWLPEKKQTNDNFSAPSPRLAKLAKLAPLVASELDSTRSH